MHTQRKTPLTLTVSAVLALGAATATAQEDRDIEELIVYGTQGGLDNATGSRLNLSLMETPATVNVLDGAAIRDRVDLNVMDAVTRSAGFSNEANPGNGHSSIAARGFTGQNAVTKLYDGTNYYTVAGTVTFPFDTWSLERIEVLKGPSSVLYGQGGIGGAINVIPRRPEFEPSGEIRVLAGENSTYFVGLDYTSALSDTVALRADLSRESSDNWVVNGDSEASMLALALRWEATPDLALTARYDRGDQEPMRYFGVPHANGGFIDALVESNFNVGDAAISYEDDSLRLKADWTLSAAATVEAEIYRLTADRYWKNAEGYVYDDASNTVSRWDPLVLAHDMEQTGMRANFSLGRSGDPVRASVGFDANDIAFRRPSNFGQTNPDPIDWGNDSDVVDVADFQPGLLSDLTDAPVMLDNMADVTQIGVFGEAIYDVTDRLALVGALRYDSFDTVYTDFGNYTVGQAEGALTGRLGAVYDLTGRTSLYSQYGTGASHPSSSVVNVSPSHRSAGLVESEQLEVGIKNRVPGLGLQWTIALFDISKNNLVTDDPDSNNPDDVIVIPEQTSRGVELSVNYALTDTLQVHGNLAALNAETNSGETPDGVPETTWNAGFAWRATNDIRVIADARYVDERPDNTPIPSYIVVDASAHWNVNDNLSLTLKADNVFDELYASGSYWWGTWIVGKPRTFSLAVDYGF